MWCRAISTHATHHFIAHQSSVVNMGICIKIFVEDCLDKLNVVVFNDDSKRDRSTEEQSMIVADFNVPVNIRSDEYHQSMILGYYQIHIIRNRILIYVIY